MTLDIEYRSNGESGLVPIDMHPAAPRQATGLLMRLVDVLVRLKSLCVTLAACFHPRDTFRTWEGEQKTTQLLWQDYVNVSLSCRTTRDSLGLPNHLYYM